jgi:hypothetical protein
MIRPFLVVKIEFSFSLHEADLFGSGGREMTGGGRGMRGKKKNEMGGFQRSTSLYLVVHSKRTIGNICERRRRWRRNNVGRKREGRRC